MTRGRDRRATADERGFTLIEVAVGMTILSVFLAIFGGAMVNMFHSVDRTQQSAYAQSEVNQAYIKLEREIRFASGISTPGTMMSIATQGHPSVAEPVVEFADTTSGDQVCTQLRLTSTGDLQQRTWIQPENGSAPTYGTTSVLAADVQADAPTAPSNASPVTSGPFSFLPANGDASNQRLEVALNARDGSQVANSNTRARHLDVTFTALNTTTSTSSASVCSTGRGAQW